MGDLDRMRAEWRDTIASFKALRSAYSRHRQNGLTMSDALSAATDDLGEKPVPVVPAEEPAKSPYGYLGLVQTILVNSVSIIGVFQLHWPVGTALALYWAENLLTGLVVTGNLALWRARHSSSIERPRTSVGEVATITLVFNAAHLLFLVAFLGFILPRIDTTEGFQRASWLEGVALIAILLLLEFVFNAYRMRRRSAAQAQLSVTAYLQRIVVLHLTIIIGMCALALFGRPRAFFAVFAGLKLIADASWRLRS